MNIINQQIHDYISELYGQEAGEAGQLRATYEAEYPIIPLETARLLVTQLHIHRPTKILEIGTCIGYSATLMASQLPEAHITTIDRYPIMIEQAKANFKKAGLDDTRVTLLEGSALEILQSMTETYDFIFLDASKGQYIYFLPEIMRLLKTGGVLMADNLLQHADIVKQWEEIEKRQRTIYVNMRKFLYEITHMAELQTSILPVGDGVSISVKKALS